MNQPDYAGDGAMIVLLALAQGQRLDTEGDELHLVVQHERVRIPASVLDDLESRRWIVLTEQVIVTPIGRYAARAWSIKQFGEYVRVACGKRDENSAPLTIEVDEALRDGTPLPTSGLAQIAPRRVITKKALAAKRLRRAGGRRRRR